MALPLALYLAPRSIALIGASPDEHRLRGRVAPLLNRNGYPGRLYQINPSHREIAGAPCYPAIGAVPEAVDLAIVLVPAEKVVDAVEQAAAAGARHALVMSSGFAEEGGASGEAQRRIGAIARRTGMRVCGPNAEGFHNEIAHVSATFSPAVDLKPEHLFTAASRRVAVVAQSGGIGFALYHRGRMMGLSFSQVITTGNEVDLTIADFLAHLVEDPETSVILLFLETVRDPASFVAAAQRAAALGKPIIVVKVGRSVAGGRATASHTASMAGWGAAYDAVFRSHGLLIAEDLDRAIAIAAALTTCPLPRGRRAAVMTVSGGTGALVADALAAAGLELPVLSAPTQAAIRTLIPSYGATQNPVDVTGQATRTGAPLKVIETLHDSGEVDFVIAAMTMATDTRAPVDPDGLRAVVSRQDRPVLFFTYTVASGFGIRALASAGVVTFMSLSDLTTAAKGLLSQAAFAATAEHRVQPRAQPPALSLPAIAGVVPEHRAKAMLEAVGIAMPASRLVTRDDDLAAAAQTLGFPLAVKIQSPDILHKTEIGGVRLRIADGAALRTAYREVLDGAASRQPDARIDGVLLERMALPGIEMLIGVVRDDTFGPIITVALGGVTAELLRDTSRRAAPVDPDEALTMLRELRGFALLDGFRGAPKADVAALADLIARVSQFAFAGQAAIRELELNPVIVHPAGQGCSVADAMIVAEAV